MITLDQFWMGRKDSYPLDMTPQIEKNALCTIDLANRFITLAKGAGIAIAETPHWGLVASGWRPPAVNAATKGAALMSKHMTGEAIDMYDPNGALDNWAYANPQILKDLGLWCEHRDYTPTWIHCQTVPPHSGQRFFIP